MTAIHWQQLTIFIGGIATLAVFSFLIRENPFYRFFEHLYIGIAAGLGIVVGTKNFLWPKILMPMLGLDIVIFPDGTTSKPYDPRLLLFIFPMAFGLLYYFIYSKRHGWIVKLPIGFALGASAGLAFKGFFNEMMPQIFGSFKPLIVLDGTSIDWAGSLSNIFFIFTLLSVMYYFFFSFKPRFVVLEKFSLSGRWLLMICFGAFFGSTVMARLALLVERLQFLLNDWSMLLVGTIQRLV